MSDALMEGREAGTAPGDERYWRIAFLVMTIPFSVCHATVTTPIGYASSVLQEEIGNASNGVLYAVTVVSSFLLAPLTNGLIGPKWGLVISMIGYTIYVALFAAASLSCEERKSDDTGCLKGGALQWALVMTGATIGGLGAGVLWTCQGAFFSAVVEKVGEAKQALLPQHATDEDMKKVKEDVSGELAGQFALYYLGLECLAKVLFTLLTQYAKLSIPNGFFIYAGASAISVVVFSFSQNIGMAGAGAQRPSMLGKALLAVELWTDPKIWLLCFTNFTFGFSVAWINGYVNANFLKKALCYPETSCPAAANFIGFLAAIIAGVSAIVSRLFSCLTPYCGKTVIVSIGAACFFAIGILSKIGGSGGWIDRGGDGPGGWGWGIVVFYILQGFGRGVYESTNKGIFADFFPGAKGPGAFANVMMQGTLSGAIAFGLNSGELTEPVIYLLLAFSLMTVPGLLMAGVVRKQQETRPARDVSMQAA